MRSRRGPVAALAVAVVSAGLPMWLSSPVQAASGTVTSAVKADAYVSSARPKDKYGPAKQLRVSGSPTQRTYLRFDVKGINGTVSNATLTLRPTAAADVPLEAHLVSGSWKEPDITWNNAPAVGALVGRVLSVPGSRLDIDVTSAVTSNATVDLVLTVADSAAQSTTVAELNSREVKNMGATLTVTYGDTAPTADTTPPSAPTGLSATAGDGSVALAWQANTEADLASYRVYRSTDGSTWSSTPTATVTAPGTTWNDTTVTNGTTYSYRITAVDTTGNPSTPSTAVTATPVAPAAPKDTTAPLAPKNLEAAPGDNTIGLSWDANTETDLAGYRVYRRLTTGESWPTTPTAEVGKDTPGWTDTSVKNGTSYDYRVTAFDTSNNESIPSPDLSIAPAPQVDMMAPAAPIGLTATAGDSTVTLAWQANTEPDLAGYRVYRRVTGGSWPGQLLTSPTGPSYIDVSAANGTSYDYRIAAVDTTGNESSPSASATARPVASGPCAASSSYASTVLGTPGLAAYWRLGDTSGTTACDAAGNSPGAYNGGYTLGSTGAINGDGNGAVTLNGTNGYVRVPSTAALTPTSAMTWEAWVSPTSTTARQTLIKRNNQYVVRIENGGFNARVWVGSTYADLSSPSVITPGYQQLALTYDGTTLKLYRNGAEVATKTVGTALAGGNNTINLGMAPNGGSGYDFLGGRLDEVSLYNTALDGPTISSHYQAGVGSTGGTGPAAGPDQLNAIGAPESVGLSWTAVANATAYRVYQRGANGSWGSPIGTTSTTSYPVRGLVDGQGYAFQVTAVVSGAETAASPTAQATATDNVLLTAGDIADSTFRSEKTAQLLDRNPGEVMMLGDAAYTDGTAAEYQNYYAPTWGRHLWRTRAAIGNHEYNTDSGNPYWDYFGSAAGPRGTGYYSYDQAGWHVVVLNSNCGKVGGCNAGSVQEQWLKADLAASTAKCTVAVWHHPRFSSTSPGAPDDSYLDFWNDLMDAGVEIVLNGHDHAYERFAPQTPTGTRSSVGVRQFTVGTGGRSEVSASSSDPNSQIRISDTFGILRLDLQAGGYSWSFLPVDGSTKTDSGSDTCH